jgi:hypothetical protein
MKRVVHPASRPTICWYVHHEGSGHGARFVAVGRLLEKNANVIGLGSVRPESWNGQWVELPRDDDPRPGERGDVGARGVLHWAPLRHEGMRARSFIVAQTLHQGRCALLVVDVSVEMLLLGRLCSVPTVAMAMRGRRDDAPHALGYDVATGILAPWPSHTERVEDRKFLAKTEHVGCFSRFDALPRDRPSDAHRKPQILLMVGRGRHNIRADDVAAAIAATPDCEWHVAGSCQDSIGKPWPETAAVHGATKDPWSLLLAADVVVGPCGGGTVAEVAAARRPFIALPQARPFDEQLVQANVLREHELAHVAETWPEPEDWPARLRLAIDRGGDAWQSFNDGCGASRAAHHLTKMAAVD